MHTSDLPPASASPRSDALAAERDTLRQGCGVVERAAVGSLEVLGADRARFLNAYVTCEIKNLAAGQGVHGFFTSNQGRILSDLVLMALGDRFWIEVPAGREQPLLEHLLKYLIADRVEMRPRGGVTALAVAGPGAAAALAQVLAAALASAAAGGEGLPPLPTSPWGNVEVAMPDGEAVAIQRHEQLGVPAMTLWAAAPLAERLRRDLIERCGALPVSQEALEVVRVEAGIPRFGHEFGAQNFPQETGLSDAVSYTKGCYLGQEVVARIHYRGGVQKTLCGLLFDGFDGGALPAAGTPLLHDGREAGSVGTVVISPAQAAPIGLAILHRRAAAPGTRLDLAGGGAAAVRPLPFVEPAG
jgi:folate-binding protein YgfZ